MDVLRPDCDDDEVQRALERAGAMTRQQIAYHRGLDDKGDGRGTPSSRQGHPYGFAEDVAGRVVRLVQGRHAIAGRRLREAWRTLNAQQRNRWARQAIAYLRGQRDLPPELDATPHFRWDDSLRCVHEEAGVDYRLTLDHGHELFRSTVDPMALDEAVHKVKIPYYRAQDRIEFEAVAFCFATLTLTVSLYPLQVIETILEMAGIRDPLLRLAYLRRAARVQEYVRLGVPVRVLFCPEETRTFLATLHWEKRRLVCGQFRMLPSNVELKAVRARSVGADRQKMSMALTSGPNSGLAFSDQLMVKVPERTSTVVRCGHRKFREHRELFEDFWHASAVEAVPKRQIAGFLGRP
jgi:hypothetical protein